MTHKEAFKTELRTIYVLSTRISKSWPSNTGWTLSVDIHEKNGTRCAVAKTENHIKTKTIAESMAASWETDMRQWARDNSIDLDS